MTDPLDLETLGRFHRRLAAIESNVKDAPPMAPRPIRPWSPPGIRPRMPWVVIPVVVAVVVLGVAVTRPVPATQTPPSTAIATVPAVGASGTTSAPSNVRPARLVVIFVQEPPASPSGVTFGGGLIPARFMARLSSADGREISTWLLQTWQLPYSPGEERLFEAGSYRLSVWWVDVVDDTNNGSPATETVSAPIAECTIDVSLAAGSLTTVLATFPWGGQPCVFTPPYVKSP
jgi:hypothetical protein